MTRDMRPLGATTVISDIWPFSKFCLEPLPGHWQFHGVPLIIVQDAIDFEAAQLYGIRRRWESAQWPRT